MLLQLLLVYLSACAVNIVAEETDPAAVYACLDHLGCVQGTFGEGLTGRYQAFLGVPFAQPPTGSLRLKNPEPVESWAPTIWQATKMRSDCIQRNYFIPSWPVSGSEDCLYMNIYRPMSRPDGAKLPVMVYIHGGGFFYGSPAILGPDFFMDTGEVILVNIYYRLGPLGFLSTNDSNMPGNFGFKDQSLALHWVHTHIGAFGGDPNMVTIFGHSAGAVSVHLHMLSPASAGLFQRAIMMSGNALSAFAQPLQDPQEQVRALVKAAGIQNVEKYCTKGLTKTLQNMDVNTLLEAGDVFKEVHNLPLINFRPVIESADIPGAFLTEQPAKLLQLGAYMDIPTMMGLVPSKGEGTVFTLAITANPSLGEEFNKHFDKYLSQFLDISQGEELQKDVDMLVAEYLQGMHEVNNATGDGINELFGDVNFYYPMYDYLQRTLKQKGTTYMYKFNFRGPTSLSTASIYSGFLVADYGVVHVDDWIYLFAIPSLYPDYEKQYPKVAGFIKDFVREFVEFAKSGKPPSFADIGPCTAADFQAAVGAKTGICNYIEFTNAANGGHKNITSNQFNVKRMELLEKVVTKGKH